MKITTVPPTPPKPNILIELSNDEAITLLKLIGKFDSATLKQTLGDDDKLWGEKAMTLTDDIFYKLSTALEDEE